MRLEALMEFSGLASAAEGWREHSSLQIGGIAWDSRRVSPGDLFSALPGLETDGHDYIVDAAAAGAAAALVERGVEADVPQIRVPDSRRAMGLAAAALHGHPGERLFTVGITGTNGKTTSTHLVRRLMESPEVGVGLIGTVRYVVGGGERPAPFTTPESPEIQAMLAAMLEAGDRSAVLEVSSHALALQRVAGLAFDVACFTNLGRDHLDFHADMDEYLAVKTSLLTDHRKPGGTAVINTDDPAGARMASELEPPVLTVGLDPGADISAEQVSLGPGGVAFTLRAGGESARLESRLQGLFNVENLLIAAAVGRVAGFDAAHIARVLSGAEGVEGRMERLPAPEGTSILLDYAHKPEALRGALQACRELGSGRLIVVFGCGGDRDRGKRPLMGRIAALGADRVFVTSDNPRTEDPEAIIEEIMAGVPAEADVVRQVDRRKAIAMAVSDLGEGDVLLIAGKGHEQYQVVGTERSPFDERAIVARAVAAVAGERVR